MEVPVTIQGSKTVEGTDQRELFSETAKTTLTFDNGAVLNLQSRVLPGQSIFLRNEQSGREILCKVLEAPAEGKSGYTDLEFTVPDPEFWGVPAEQAEAAGQQHESAAEEAAPAAEKPEVRGATEAAAENTLAMMSAPASTMTVPPVNPRVGAELVPAHEAVPETSAAPTGSAPSEAPSAAPHEEIVPAHAQAPEPPPSASLPDATGAPHDSENVPEFNHAKFEETLAALLDGDAKRAKRAATAKEKETQKAASQSAVEGETGEAAAGEAEAVPVKPTLEQRLTTGKGAIIVEIAASVVIAVCLGLIWRAVRYPSAYEFERPVAASVTSKQKAQAAAARPAVKPVSAVASALAGTAAAAPIKAANASGAAAKAPGNSTGAAPAQLASKAKQPEALQAPTIPVARNSVTASVPAGAAPESKAVASSPEPTGPRVIVSRNAITADSGIQENHRKSGEPDSNGNIPARIVSEVQPAFPSWAKSLDVDGVVKLDALIDEKGNVTQTKVLSGPRPLQHAAEQAVGLWIFEPAQSDGKPTATHMILTVEFQR